MNQERFSNRTVLNSHKEMTDFLFLTLPTNIPGVTVAESEILAISKEELCSK